jgi:hypothetical protein
VRPCTRRSCRASLRRSSLLLADLLVVRCREHDGRRTEQRICKHTAARSSHDRCDERNSSLSLLLVVWRAGGPADCPDQPCAWTQPRHKTEEQADQNGNYKRHSHTADALTLLSEHYQVQPHCPERLVLKRNVPRATVLCNRCFRISCGSYSCRRNLCVDPTQPGSPHHPEVTILSEPLPPAKKVKTRTTRQRIRQ